MNSFGRGSRKHLRTVDARLQRIAHRALRITDHSITCGHRTREAQDAAFEAGNSKIQWPDGKHNRLPSVAMDVQVWPRPEKEEDLIDEQLYLLGVYKGVGQEQGIPIRTGADFNRNGRVSDNEWKDLFHVEIDE